MSGTPWHNTVFPHQTEDILDRGTGPSGNSVQPVHTGLDHGTEKPDDGKPLAHSDAHLYVQPNERQTGFFHYNTTYRNSVSLVHTFTPLVQGSKSGDGATLLLWLSVHVDYLNSRQHMRISTSIPWYFIIINLYGGICVMVVATSSHYILYI